MSGAPLMVRPITLRAANAFVAKHHRHSAAVRGCLFCVSLVTESDVVVGVAIAGRPKAGTLDDGVTMEVLRVCTLGHKNACSKLYAACCRAARCIGYKLAITYTLKAEHGTSARASGFVDVATTRGGEWDREGRARGLSLFSFGDVVDPRKQNFGKKTRWERVL